MKLFPLIQLHFQLIVVNRSLKLWDGKFQKQTNHVFNCMWFWVLWWNSFCCPTPSCSGCELFLRPQNMYCIHYPLVRYSVAQSSDHWWPMDPLCIHYPLVCHSVASSVIRPWVTNGSALYTLPPFRHLAAFPSIRSFIICHTQAGDSLISHSVAVSNVNPHCICYPSVNHTVT